MFTAIDNGVLGFLPIIRPQGLAVYYVLKSHYNQRTKKAFPSIERIATLCFLTEKTVIKYLRILENVGLIKITKRWVTKRKCFHEYEFPEPPVAYPWEHVMERNTPKQDPKQKRKNNAKDMPLKGDEEEKNQASEETEASEKTAPKGKTEEEVCQCEETVTFADGRIVCTKCLRSGFGKDRKADTPKNGREGIRKRLFTRLRDILYSWYSSLKRLVQAPLSILLWIRGKRGGQT